MPFIGELILDSLETEVPPKPHGNRIADAAPHDAYPALGTDAWVAISVSSDPEWQRLAEIIGAPQLGSDPRYAKSQTRWRNQDDLREPISIWTRQQTKHAAAALLQEAGIAAAPVQNGREIAEDPYLIARGFFNSLDHPEAGRRTYQGMPFKFSLTAPGQHRASPCLGEHTLMILRDILRLTEAEIDALSAARTISNLPS
jgi:crotonobetainyl-CoA:carnitine CoA-transferase CaiB-like acyl-CoA transferase